jgi:hypothetical protein
MELMEVDMLTKQKACSGCGYCCLKAPCTAAVRLYPGVRVCPALKWDGKRHICDLMNLPDDLGRTYRKELAAGEGCCCSLNSWRREKIVNRLEEVEIKEEVIPEIFQIFLNRLGREWISPDALFLTVYGFKNQLIINGYSEKRANSIMSKVLYYLRGNQASYLKSFMGSLDESLAKGGEL